MYNIRYDWHMTRLTTLNMKWYMTWNDMTYYNMIYDITYEMTYDMILHDMWHDM